MVPSRALRQVLAIAAALGALVAPRPSAAVIRLGSNVTPSSETLALTVDPRQAEYSGTATIAVEVHAAADSFRLHAEKMSLGKVTLSNKAGSIPLTSAAGEEGIVTLRATKAIAPGLYTLTIPFTNEFDLRANSLYKVMVEGESYAFTDFEPDDARGAWPCFDEPSFKIPWRVIVTSPLADRVIGNMPVDKEKKAGATKTTTFEETPPMSSYLVALAVGPLEVVPVRGMSIPGNIVTVKGRAAFAAEAARQMPPIVAALEQYFDRPFPYPKCDLLAVPEFYAGAMENAGAITFREEILLLDPKGMTPRQRARMAGTIAHELAHMWFGDLVTLAWWDDVWLNESFASWLGDKVTNQVYPEFGERVRQVRDVQRAMITDARPSTRVIRSLGDAGDLPLDRLFDPLAYQKGQAVLQMFEAWIGPDLFRQGVQSYIHQHEWGNAVGADLWRALSRASGRDLSGPLSGFIEQAGVPLVSAEIGSDGRVKLTQSRFHNYGATVSPSKWSIPVLLKYEANGQVRTKWVMLTEAEQTFALPDAARPTWIDPNGSETGYYRWSVPGTMLVQMAESASRTLDARERLGFLENASALLDAGLVRGDEYLRILSQFSSDTEPEVGQAMLEGLVKVRETFVEDQDRDAFAGYVRHALNPWLTRIGRLPQAGEKDGVTTLRSALLTWLADDGRDATIQAFADSLGRAYRANPESIPSSLVDVAIQVPATRGDATLFAEYRAHIASARLPVDRARWLTGLGWFRSPALVDSSLAYSLAGQLRPQERGAITRALLERKENQQATYEWMTRNYDAILAATSVNTAPFLPFYAGGCSAERLAQAKQFFAEPTHNKPGVPQSLAQVSDVVNDCVGLKQREGAPVQAFLRQVATAK